jgi:uncharacterized integral membrane protein
MSAPVSSSSAKPSRSARAKREKARIGAMVVLTALITLFAVLNVKAVRVDWIFGSGNAPLIVVIVISLLVGIIITHFAERYTGRKH